VVYAFGGEFCGDVLRMRLVECYGRDRGRETLPMPGPEPKTTRVRVMVVVVVVVMEVGIKDLVEFEE
jgi:hypothetical protein